MKRLKIILFLVIIASTAGILYGLATRGVFLPTHKDDLDRFLESRMEFMESPGLAASIIDDKGIKWAGYYGAYDGTYPVTENTLFMMVSVSKTFIVTAIMQLWEQDLFELDDDINDYLDFDVRNPNFTDESITFRDLLTHRSSIHDRYPFLADTYTTSSGGGDSTWDLGEFLEDYLVPGGQFYSKDNFLDKNPGEQYEYSNYGAALLAYLVEVFSGESFAEYCNNNIFSPLGMNHSYFLLADIPPTESEIAVPFHNGTPLPHYSYPDYPTGSLRTTIPDMALYVSFYLDPASANKEILTPATIDLIFGEYGETDTDDQIGLLWFHEPGNGIGHTGWDDGVATALTLYPDEGKGVLLILNSDPKRDYVISEIMNRLRGEIQE